MIRRFTIGALIVIVLLITANDTWRYVQAQQQLRDMTYKIARWAAENAPSMTRNQAAAEIVAMAATSNVTVTMYGQTEQGVRVWTQKEVPGTIVASTLANMLVGKSFSEAMNTPMVIKDYRQAGIE